MNKLLVTLIFLIYGTSALTSELLGVENGNEVLNTNKALEKLHFAYSSPVEIILGTAISPVENFDSPEANPFGHIAIRIENLVYTVNQNARKLKSKSLFYVQPLRDYLYGTKSPGLGAEIGSHFGLAYSRANYGILIKRFSMVETKKMLFEIEKIDEQWLRGDFEYSDYWYNCVDITARIYKASGKLSGPNFYPISMPTQTFKKIWEIEKDNSRIVSYERVSGAKNFYGFNRFLISIYSVEDMVGYFFKDKDEEHGFEKKLNDESYYHLISKADGPSIQFVGKNE